MPNSVLVRRTRRTQDEEVGVRRTGVSTVERGLTNPSLMVPENLVRALGIRVSVTYREVEGRYATGPSPGALRWYPFCVPESAEKEVADLRHTLETSHDLDVMVLKTYARLWQLERWLRRIVYVELRALAGDAWEANVKAAPKAERSRGADKRLTHMPTPDYTMVSFAQLADLDATILDNWNLFKPYLPPQKQWEARMDESKQIRHRVAHFRSVHDDDLARVTQLLRDLDDGVWRFCTSYNDPQPILPPSDDPVVARFLEHDPFPWSEVAKGRWARVGIRDPNALFAMNVGVLRRPWEEGDWPDLVAGTPGYLYDVHIHASPNRTLDCAQFLIDTKPLHDHLVYIHPNGPRYIRLTIPAVLGKQAVSELLSTMLRWTPNALGSTWRYRDENADAKLASEWPEYVLSPFDDPMSFLGPENPCSVFGA